MISTSIALAAETTYIAMGNITSFPVTRIPSSLLGRIDPEIGEINEILLYFFRQRQFQEELNGFFDDLVNSDSDNDADIADGKNSRWSWKTRDARESKLPYRMDDNVEQVRLQPTGINLYHMYASCPKKGKRVFEKTFKRRF